MDQFEFDFEVQDTTVNEDHNVSFGDVWILGRHVLKCGDSCSDLDVQDLMGGDLADMVFTDPPYGMGKETEGVSNDNLNQSDLLAFNKIWIPISLNYLKQNGSWYCWGKDEPLMDIYSEIIKPLKNERAERKITFCNLLTWDKGRGGLAQEATQCAGIRRFRRNAFSS